MGLLLGALFAVALADAPVPDLELRDASGAAVRLHGAPGRATVVVFLNADCPMAQLSAPRLAALAGRFAPPAVRFLAVAVGEDAPAPEFARGLPFPYLRDPDGRLADALGATRSPQAFVLDADRRVRYRGRVDDQYAPGGVRRPKPSRDDLAEALAEVVAGRPVAVPLTECAGCLLDRPRRAAAPPAVTYGRDIAPILERHCVACHRPGEVAPFALTDFASARAHAGTVAEAVAAGTMPPWGAAPEFGHFRNARRLDAESKRLVAEWVRLGCPEGPPAPAAPRPPLAGWANGTPDAVFGMPAAFAVPAEGVVEYQHFFVDPGFAEEVWVSAVEVRPGNRRVVHHCTVLLAPPGETDPEVLFGAGPLKSHSLTEFIPGSGPMRLPEGLAKRVPAGSILHFVMHYTPVGTPQTDRTEVALEFLPAGRVRREVATKVVMPPGLSIPPHAPAHRVRTDWTADRDYRLLSVTPHMHLRGKSFRYDALYPDGTAEVLLDVPAYDFNWQHRYELAEHKLLPAGTVIRCTAVYDNSAGNPSNPDPTATVKDGQQSWQEMLNGFLDVTLADQDLPAEAAAAEARQGRTRLAVAAGVAVALGGLALRRRWAGRLAARG